MVVMCIHLPTC